MILRLTQATGAGDHCLRLVFNNGTQKTVDLWSLLHGPIFEPLHDPAYFAQFELDKVCGTVVWPNGADFAPEALHELDALDEQGDEEIVHFVNEFMADDDAGDPLLESYQTYAEDKDAHSDIS